MQIPGRLITIVAASLAACSHVPEPAPGSWALTGTRVYVAPDAPPIDDGIVLVEGDKIVAVGPAASMRLRGDTHFSACSGGVITAGFQNSHVHFTEPVWQNAGSKQVSELESRLEQMLTRFGFTTVFDTASDLAHTGALRGLIERGEIRGPRILTAGLAMYPPNGIPFYLADLPPEVLQMLPQPATPEQAMAVVARNFGDGANATKLFIATPQRDGTVKRMPAAVARAAVEATHARGGKVIAHPTDNAGLRAAVAAGVDMLAHTTLENGPTVWDPALVRSLIERDVAVIPTLKLWPYELAKTRLPQHIRDLALADAIEEVRVFVQAGGRLLFGTDVGYMTDYDPTDEYVSMGRAGLTPLQILAALTTAPAAEWQESTRRGRVEPGLDADLVVLDADPAADVRNFVNVRCAFRAGKEIFAKPNSGS